MNLVRLHPAWWKYYENRVNHTYDKYMVQTIFDETVCLVILFGRGKLFG